MSTPNQDPPRLYHRGTVGMMVVLDHVGLSPTNSFADYQKPAFFTITEVSRGEKPAWDTTYILRDTTGHEVSTEGSSVSSYLIQIDEWQKWRKAKTEQTHYEQTQIIATLRDRVALLRGIMVEQGVRVVSGEQAVKLGINK